WGGMCVRYMEDEMCKSVGGGNGGCVNPFVVLNELESGLKHHTMIRTEEQRKRYVELLSVVKDEYEDIVKNEVQRAISADEVAISRLCADYIRSVEAYKQNEQL